jgi:hypothetical protein
MSEMDRENAYYESLPKCVWCRDAIDEHDGQMCEKCNGMVCVDHCSTLISGRVVCLECKSQELEQIRRMARSEPLDEIFGVAV